MTTSQRPAYRLHYYVGDLVHYTEWTDDFAVVENLAEQYRRSDTAHDVTIQRRHPVDGAETTPPVVGTQPDDAEGEA